MVAIPPMYVDPVTLTRYPSAEALAKAQLRRSALLSDTAAWSTAHHQRAEQLRAAQLQPWLDAGYQPRNAVLLTTEASREILPRCATPAGTVQLDALLLEIHPDAGNATCRMWFTDDPQTVHLTLRFDQLERPLGHPFSIWNRIDPRITASQRAHRHQPHPNPHYRPRSEFWSE